MHDAAVIRSGKGQDSVKHHQHRGCMIAKANGMVGLLGAGRRHAPGVEDTDLVVSASILAMEEHATSGLLNGKCHRD